MDYGTLIEKRKARLTEIEKLMEDPGFFNDQRNSTQYMREHRSLKKLIGLLGLKLGDALGEREVPLQP